VERAAPFVGVEALRRSYGDLVAVAGIDFEIGAGEVFGLLGPNGAGKSTTMRMLAGLLKPDSGTILIEGHPLNADLGSSRKRMGFVPQDLAIYPELTARENLRFFGSLYGYGRKELEDRVSEVLELTGLTPRADDLVQVYSGGMKRRLNLGVAMVHQPKLLILDEPTVGVDPQSRTHLLKCVLQLSGEGVAVIYASHYMEEVQLICSRVAIMDHGKILVNDRLERLLAAAPGRAEITVAGWDDAAARDIGGQVTAHGEEGGVTRLVIQSPAGEEADLGDAVAGVLAGLREHGVHVRAIDTRESNLESLFLDLTGRQLRE
jgi:ABC-2 type transport system ATP-binding protein